MVNPPAQSTQRKQREDGQRSHRAILDAAAKLATVEGLEGLSIGQLADHIGMSKSGLYAHFRSKQELQLATIGTAREMFSAEVISPAEQAPTPLAKLELVCELFLSHLERKVFPGGCFFASAAAELDTHPGPVREQIAEFQRGWMKLLTELVREAQSAEELPAEDADQFAFELNSYLLMANTAFLLQNDPEWIERARTAVTARVSRR